MPLTVFLPQPPVPPNRYTWEIVREHEALPLEESCDRFGSWEEASQAGKKALERNQSVEETH